MEGFDIRELTKFQEELLDIADVKMPKESKKFLRKEGLRLKRLTLKTARQKVKKKTGNYAKSIKRGQVYKYRENGALSVRVFSNAPHAHLIEYGHRQLAHPSKIIDSKGKEKSSRGRGKEIGFVKGKRVFEKAQKQFDNEFYDDTQDFIDDLLDKGLS